MFEDGAEIVGEATDLFSKESELSMGVRSRRGTGSNIIQRVVNRFRKKPDIFYDVNVTKEAIFELASYSMLTRESESFIVHRMVQAALRSRIPEERRRDWIELSLQLVSSFAPTPPNDVCTWPVWDTLRPHAIQVAQSADDVGITDSTAYLLGELAILLDNKGLYREAEPLIRRALEIDEESFGPHHPKISTRLNNLAQLLQDMNRLSEAETLMRRALEINENSLVVRHPRNDG